MKPRMTEEQILTALAQATSGDTTSESGNPGASMEARCMQLEEENRRLKLLVADLTLRNEALKLVAWKKW